jgi:type I restriction enzyme M protein
MNLSSTIKSIQDIMRKDDGIDGDAQRIGQLAWMLFLKIFDQCEMAWEKDIAVNKEKYVSVIPKKCRWRNWAAFKNGKAQKQAIEIVTYINETVFPGLKGIDPKKDPKSKVVHEVFVDANNYMKTGTLILGVIQKLEDVINFHDIKARGQLGEIYEQILNDLRSAGNAGEFYTPRAVTEFMVAMVNPILKKGEVVLDPACGTGGFLTATIAHFEKQMLNEKVSKDNFPNIDDCIRGIEKKQLPHLLCITNMLLHGIEVPSMVEHNNTLAKPWESWQSSDRVDCLITNPPFGGMEDSKVGNDYPPDVQSRETADMFLILIIEKLLKEKIGRCAIVLPDGMLFGEGVKAHIKEKLLEKCNLHTIVRLPSGVFNPYTGIKTNLLFFRHGKPTETIWFYEHKYPDGIKSYSKTKPMSLEELEPIRQWWSKEADGFKARIENERAWKIDFKKIKDDARAKAQPYWDNAESLNNKAAALNDEAKELRFTIKNEKKESTLKKLESRLEAINVEIEKFRQQAKDEQTAGDRIYWPIYKLDIKNPNSSKDESLDPDVLLKKFKELTEEIETTQKMLKNELASALKHHFDSEEDRG